MLKPAITARPELYIERRVLVLGGAEQIGDKPRELPLSALRDEPAYVLLGDPGAGKSTALWHESSINSHDKYLRAVTLLQGAELPKNGIAFIDALDEARAGGGDQFTPVNTLLKRLRNHGVRRFRLSCREMDWYGDSDRASFEALLPAGGLAVATLLPFDEKDLSTLIGHEGEADPAAFIHWAHEQGLDTLLANPNTAKLLVKAKRQSGLLRSKQDVYRLACHALVKEDNREHAARTKRERPRDDELLDAAGALCAVLLLSAVGAVGYGEGPFSSDVLAWTARPAALPALSATLQAALGSSLFSARVGTDREMESAHRTVAEYLAARYLSDRLRGGLSVRRVLAMTSVDGSVVSSLRGLNAWLATLCDAHRSDFIAVDPLGVALYGDALAFSQGHRQQVFEGLARQAKQTEHFSIGHWQAMPNPALASPDMAPYLAGLINSADRSAAHLALLDIARDSLHGAKTLPGLAQPLETMVGDASYPKDLRDTSLRTGIKVEAGANRNLELYIGLGRQMPRPDRFLQPLVGALDTAAAYVSDTCTPRAIDIQVNEPEARLARFFADNKSLIDLANPAVRLVHLQPDLPDTRDILRLENQGQRYAVSDACLIGAKLQCGDDPLAANHWPDALASRLLAFHLTGASQDDPPWLQTLINDRPDLVADVYLRYATGRLRAGHSDMNGWHRLGQDADFAPITARIMLPLLLAWPTRNTAEQAQVRRQVHDAAWAYLLDDDLQLLAAQKLASRSLAAAQRVHWLAVQTVLQVPKALEGLQAELDRSDTACDELLALASLPGLSHQLEQLPLPTQSTLWQRLARRAQPAGFPRDAVTGWLNRLAAHAGTDATAALDAWLADDRLAAWHKRVRALRYQQRAITRDSQYQPASAAAVAQMLANRGPASVADLQALVLDQLDALAQEIQRGDAQLWNQFWWDKGASQPKDENDCRNVILPLLRANLTPLTIDITPEQTKVDASRCDLQATCMAIGQLRQRSLIPIEIKRAFHPDLWTAMRTQLIDRYAQDPAAQGHGIYLVLWFGPGNANRLKPHPMRLPVTNPMALARLLEAALRPDERSRIQIVVLDVSPHQHSDPP